MIESPRVELEVLDHPGTWLTNAGGYSDFVLRGPRPLKPGLPGPLYVAGIVLPFSNFLPGAVQWCIETEGKELYPLSEADSTERTVLGTFSWGVTKYLVSFVFFEDLPPLAPSAQGKFSSR